VQSAPTGAEPRPLAEKTGAALPRERERDATREMPESPTPLALLPDEHTLMPATAEDFPLVTIIGAVSA
jgi:hypothetical protein